MQKKYVLFSNSLNGGGAEKVICLLANYLQENNEVILVKIDPSESVYPLSKNVKICSLSSNFNYKPFYRFLFFPIYAYKLFKLLKKYKPNFSISFLPIPNFLNVGVCNFFFKNSIKTVVNERCYPSIAYRSSKLRYHFYKALIPFFYNKADYVFANTERIILDLKNNFSLKKEGQVFYNPVGFSVNPIVKNIHKKETIKILMIGRLSREKGYDVALNCMESLKNKNKNYELHIFGEGNQREYLEDQISNLKLNKYVFLHGHKKNIKKVINNYDLFLMTSKTEGFPNALIEAMSFGLPVVSTNCLSGPLEILNFGKKVEYIIGFSKAKFGFLTRVSDVCGIVNAITSLSEENRYNKYSELAIKRARFFETEKVLKDFIEKIYL